MSLMVNDWSHLYDGVVMGRMRVFALAALSAWLVLMAQPAISNEEVTQRSFFPADLAEKANREGARVFSMGDDSGIGFSQLGRWPDMICASTKDPNCVFPQPGAVERTPYPFGAQIMLGVCAEARSEDCIEGVKLRRGDGEFVELRFLRYQSTQYYLQRERDGEPFPADPSMNLPEGIHPSIWEEIRDGQASPLKYFVYYKYNMGYDPQEKKFYIQGVRLSIRPFRVEAPSWSALWSSETSAGIQYEFPEGVTYQITVRVTNKANGWYKARLASPDVQLDRFSATNNRLTVAGKPVTVPVFTFTRKVTELTEREKGFKQALKGVHFVEPGMPEIFSYLEYFRPLVNDTTAYAKQYWTINSTNWESSNPCLSDKTRVVGIVSTNAMGYEGSAPLFREQTLSYKVAGFHYSADGTTLNKGTYDLIIRSDAARCLYGFSDAPLSAVVSVTGATGTENVASTIISERDGWLRLNAAGFTFSEKTINIKLLQPTTATTPTISTSETKSTEMATIKPTKKFISCVRGGVTKKVSGTNPRCPKGFKRALKTNP